MPGTEKEQFSIQKKDHDMETNIPSQKYPWSAAQFAFENHVKAQSVRARLCRYGSYFGVVPLKLANGRLAFPAIQVTK